MGLFSTNVPGATLIVSPGNAFKDAALTDLKASISFKPELSSSPVSATK